MFKLPSLMFILLLILGSYYYSNYFGVRNSPSFFYGEFYCSGDEARLIDCRYSSYYLRYCYSHDQAGISCTGNVLLYRW